MNLPRKRRYPYRPMGYPYRPDATRRVWANFEGNAIRDLPGIAGALNVKVGNFSESAFDAEFGKRIKDALIKEARVSGPLPRGEG